MCDFGHSYYDDAHCLIIIIIMLTCYMLADREVNPKISDVYILV